MKLRDWLKDLDYELLQGDLDTEAEDVVYDSRKAQPGTIFVCLKGTRIDSHGFIGDVAAQGVTAFVVKRDVELPEGATVVRVESSRHALAMLSGVRFGNPIRRMISVGVTGTKGKTTTTHMIKAILEAAGKKVGMIGTTGAVIGDQVTPTVNTTPESYTLQEYLYKMAEAGCEYVLMEVSSQGIKMHRTDGLFFDYGVFTNITPDHIGPDEHADFDEYLYYKSRLFSLCLVGNTSSGGTDFFAIYFSEKHGRDIWNYILGANALMLFTAGLLFGWDAALYSIIFQFTSTQVVQMLHQRYKKHTLFIITEHPEEVYESIRYLSHHSATRFEGTGCYSDKKLTLLYSVVSREEAKLLVRNVHEVDPHAFVNIIKTDYINGRFYHKTDY